MAYRFIEGPEDQTPTEYAAYLNGQISWANGVLKSPEQKWPKGTSHGLARKVIAESSSFLVTKHKG